MSLTVGDPWSPQFHRTTASASSSSSDQWSYKVMYESSSCDDMPVALYASRDCSSESKSQECSPVGLTGTSSNSNDNSADTLTYEIESCTDNIEELIDSLYGDQAYFRFDDYWNEGCEVVYEIGTYVVDRGCHGGSALDTDHEEMATMSWRMVANNNGSISFQSFHNGDCSGDAYVEVIYEREELESNECVNGNILSTTAKAGDSSAQVSEGNDDNSGLGAGNSSAQASEDNDDNSGLGAGTIAGVVVACIVAVGLV